MQDRVDGVVRMKNVVDERGCLSAINFAALPFVPKRMFVVHNVPFGQTRGKHAHKECKQLLICTRGTVSLISTDTAGNKSRNNLYIGETFYHPNMEWLELDYSHDAEVISLCSTEHDPDDYIHSYQEFMRLAKNEQA